MGSFYTYDFMFDGVPSHLYDLKIISLSDEGLFTGVGSSDVEILTQRVLRKSKPYYLGRTQPTVLSFPLTFGSTTDIITGLDRNLISKWLFGRSGYKKLEILQDDLNGAYFNCFMTAPQPLYIGGLNYAFTAQIVCDSPWAYRPQKTYEFPLRILKDMGDFSQVVSGTYTLYNESAEDEYLYPNIVIKQHEYHSGSIIFYNETDSGSRVTIVGWLDAGDIITMNGELQIITRTDSTGTISKPVLSNFNKNWFRMVPKNNTIVFPRQGLPGGLYNPSECTFVYTERMKIGG